VTGGSHGSQLICTTIEVSLPSFELPQDVKNEPGLVRNSSYLKRVKLCSSKGTKTVKKLVEN